MSCKFLIAILCMVIISSYPSNVLSMEVIEDQPYEMYQLVDADDCQVIMLVDLRSTNSMIMEVLNEHPDVKYIIVDMDVDAPDNTIELSALTRSLEDYKITIDNINRLLYYKPDINIKSYKPYTSKSNRRTDNSTYNRKFLIQHFLSRC